MLTSKMNMQRQYYTTFNSIMNAKLSKEIFWLCHKSGLIKTNDNLCEFQVVFSLLWAWINQDKPKVQVNGN